MSIGQDTPYKERVRTVADLVGAGVIAAEEAHERGDDTPTEYIIRDVLVAASATDFFPALPEGHQYSREYLGPIIARAMDEWLKCHASVCEIGGMFDAIAAVLVGPDNAKN